MKVIFDSNVWRIVVLPEDFPNEALLSSFEKIKEAIISKEIDPYLSETVFTIEAIRRVERQDFFSSQRPEIAVKEKDSADEVELNFSMGPNSDDAIRFEERPILKKYFDAAVQLGFKIVRLPRIAGLINPDVDAVRFKLEGQALADYHDKVFEVVRKIEDHGAGMSQIEAIGLAYNKAWFKGLKQVPEANRNTIASAAAEWADGDSVAISIALGCDYFCTRDQARGAGQTSVLSAANLAWLNRDYGFRTILPQDLANLL